MKKIVVFGATGNVGAYLVDYYHKYINKDEYEIVAVGRKDTRFFSDKGIKYCRVDITREEDFSCLPNDNVYAVVNAAGVLPAYLKDNNPFIYIETNIKGGVRILEYARKVNADRVLYTQTWAEQAGYWGINNILSPEMPRKLLYTGDHAFYTISKTMIVETMEYYRQEYGIKNFVFRLPNVYLYHPEKYYYVDGVRKLIGYRHMIDLATEGKTIELWGDPNAYKDILYIKDLCQMMYKALFAKVDGGIYNAGTGLKTTLREQIEGMVEVFSPANHKSQILEKPDGASFISFVMDIKKAQEELGYEPEYTYIKYLDDYKKEREMKRFDNLWKK